VPGPLDTAGLSAHPSAMAENPYAVRLEDFEARVRVPVTEQVVAQPVQVAPTDLDWGSGNLPVGDGGDGGGCD
jgi:hypothetical protein